jgi:hypothetical protein
MSCGGKARGGGGWEIVGGRQSGGGGLVRGGPWYSVSGARGGVGAGGGVGGVDAGSGRCQYASSGTPVGELTFTDGTAEGGRRLQWRGLPF